MVGNQHKGLSGYTSRKGNVGANAQSRDDGVCGLIINGTDIAVGNDATGLEIGKVYQITKLKDAEGMGITANYDSVNKINLHRHISEFYRMAGEGANLYFIVCPLTKTMAEMINEYSHILVSTAEGRIRYIAVGYNCTDNYTPVYVDGLEQVVREAIAPAQDLHNWTWETDRPANVFLEGRGISGTVASMLDLKNITTGSAKLHATNVSICIGQDYEYAEKLSGETANYADIGTMLGCRASLPVNRDIGEVETMNLTDAVKKKWLVPALSNHRLVSEIESDLGSYDAKGYIFALSYTGISGVRWNGQHVCAPEIVDDDGNMNESTIAYGAVLGKASRAIRKRLLPKLRGTFPADTETGYLPLGVIKYFEGLGMTGLNELIKASEISGGTVKVDPTSNLLQAPKELRVEFMIVPTGSINQITSTLNLKTSLGNA